VEHGLNLRTSNEVQFLCKSQRVTPEKGQCWCATALEEAVVSSAHVVNLLHRAAQAPRPALLQVPEALVLTHEPVADCARYDRLRVPPPDPFPHHTETLCKLN
jgi:hypothetical protein